MSDPRTDQGREQELDQKLVEVANALAKWINETPLQPSAIHPVYGGHVLLMELIRQHADLRSSLDAALLEQQQLRDENASLRVSAVVQEDQVATFKRLHAEIDRLRAELAEASKALDETVADDPDKNLSAGVHDLALMEGIRRYLLGEQIGASMDISDTPSYGYGKLDNYGFWEFPVPAALVDWKHDVDHLTALTSSLEGIAGDMNIRIAGHSDGDIALQVKILIDWRDRLSSITQQTGKTDTTTKA